MIARRKRSVDEWNAWRTASKKSMIDETGLDEEEEEDVEKEEIEVWVEEVIEQVEEVIVE